MTRQPWALFAAALLLVAACSEGPGRGMLEIELTLRTDESSTATLPIVLCQQGVIIAEGSTDGEWQVHLDVEGGGPSVAVIVDAPGMERLEGFLTDGDQPRPFFPGSGTAELRPAGQPGSEPASIELAWDC